MKAPASSETSEQAQVRAWEIIADGLKSDDRKTRNAAEKFIVDRIMECPHFVRALVVALIRRLPSSAAKE